MKSLLTPLAVGLFLTSFAFSDNKVLFDFDSSRTSGSWRSVNDNVMGGVSKGGFRINDGKMIFSGDLSLKNNGGFSSIRTNRSSINLSQYDAMVIRVRGDGRQYTMNIGTNAWIPAGSYWSKFDTNGRWQEIRLPFSSFKATAFGKPYRLAGKMNPAQIRTMGFTIADKKAGEFFLEVDWIQAVKENNAGARGPAGPNEAADIVDIAVKAGSFNTLVAAVKAADLVDTLKSPGPFTVFAPTDEAFSKLPKGTVESLLERENKDRLAAVLKYHVVPGRMLLGNKELKTVQGGTLKLDSGKSFMVNESAVLKANIEASNGVIHVIDRVLLPKLPEPSAMKLIEGAIRKGVPLFNSGHVDRCASIYESAVIDLMGMSDDKIGVENRKTLNAALKKGLSESARSKAWTLRRAMDRVYVNLKK
jgi:uncharacterized surface protein with fasciclin (FAS1) repeats